MGISLLGCSQDSKKLTGSDASLVQNDKSQEFKQDKQQLEVPRSTDDPSIKKDKGITQSEIESLLKKETKLRYKEFFDSSKEGPVIPGLLQDLVPQGLSYYKEKNWLVISNYRTSKQASTLTIVDAASGKHIKTIHLYNEDGTPHTGHASGVAISKDNLWISAGSTRPNWSGCMFYQVKLDDIVKCENDAKIKFVKSYKTGTLSSFINYNDGVLWIGDYSSLGGNQPDESHRIKNRDNTEYRNWIAGYKLDSTTDSIPDGKETDSWGAVVPDYILSITENIQGMTFAEDKIILSQSPGEGALSGSQLIIYRNIIGEDPHDVININNINVPLWFLDSKGYVESTLMPPMAEGIAAWGKELYILFESGAANYRYSSSYPWDRIQLYYQKKD